MVREVEANGVLRLTPIGSLDKRSLSYRNVRVCPDLDQPESDLFGTLVPPSPSFLLNPPKEASSDIEPDEFLVDLGPSFDEGNDRIRIGDMVVFDSPLRMIGNAIVGGCLDNRVACWIILRAVEKMRIQDYEIFCVFTAQEEVGLRGAGPAAFEIQPDIAFVVDMMLAPDNFGGSARGSVPKLGAGPVISVMDGGSISDIALMNSIEVTAKEHQIPVQRSIMMCGGTDSAAIQRSIGGVRTVSLACAARYLHTPTEMVSRGDVEACRDLLTSVFSSRSEADWRGSIGGNI